MPQVENWFITCAGTICRARTIFLGGVGAFFSKIRNLENSQSCLYGLTLADTSSIFSTFSSSGNAKLQLVVLIEFSICSLLAKYVK